MEYIDFKKLIDALTAKPKETEWLEFKHNFHSKEEIGERISALSNSSYLCNMPFGYIVFGVDDESHDVVGTDLYGKQKMIGNEELESWLSTRLNPRIDFEIIDDFNYEEKGSGMDKTIFYVELYQLPPVRFQLYESRTTATVFSYRKFADLDKSERVRACYQHACLKYVSNEKMNNQSFRTRLGIEDKNYPMASRIIKDTLEAKLIKEENAEGGNRHNYIPYWA